MPDADRPNNTKILQFGTKKGLLQGHVWRWVACALRNPKLLKVFSKALFKAKGEGGVWLVVANSWVSDPLSLRSGHHQVTMFL